MGPPDRLDVNSIDWSISGFNWVRLEWTATTNRVIGVLNGNGRREYSTLFLDGLKDDETVAGHVGDIVLTSDGAFDGAHYDILLFCTKIYVP